MKILIINTTPFVQNGISHMIINYCSELKNDEGVSFDFIGNGLADPEIKKKLFNISDNIVILSSRKKSISYWLELRKILMEIKYDIVHIHGNSALMVPEVILSQKYTNSKIVTHVHNVMTEHKFLHALLERKWKRKLEDVARFAAGNEAGRWVYHDFEYRVIPNAVDPVRFKYSSSERNNVRKRLNIPKSAPVLIHVGNYNTQKNRPFLDCLTIDIVKKNPEIHVIYIGDSKNDSVKLTESTIRENMVEKNFHILKSQSDIESYFSASDIFLFPSLWEAMPLVPVEAQYNGLKIFLSNKITKLVGISDQVFFLPLDQDIWCNQIKKSLKNRNHVSIIENDNFDIRVQAKLLKETYEKILNGQNIY